MSIYRGGVWLERQAYIQDAALIGLVQASGSLILVLWERRHVILLMCLILVDVLTSR
jgi:hypothetical protein